MQCTTFIKQVAVVAALLTLQPGCKLFHKTGMNKQAKEIRREMPDVDVTSKKDSIEVVFKPTVLFALDKAEIPEKIKSNLDRFADVLVRYPESRVIIRGHTDDLGSETHNLALSEERARMVKDYLAARGVAASRMAIKGYGATAPRYENDSEASRAKNRRVEFLVFL